MSESDMFVLLCRHAPHDNGKLRPKAESSDKSADAAGKSGASATRYPAQDVAQVLREELLFDRLDDKPRDPVIRLGVLLYAPTPEATATARQLAEGLALTERRVGSTTKHRLIETHQHEDAAGIQPAHYSYEEADALNPAQPRTTTSLKRCMQRIGIELNKSGPPDDPQQSVRLSPRSHRGRAP